MTFFATNSKVKHLTQLHAFKKIQSFEKNYYACLTKTDPSFESALANYLELQKIHQSLFRYIQLLRLKPSVPASRTIVPVLDAYAAKMDQIDQLMSFWLKLYLGFIWPEEILSKKLKKKIKRAQKDEWQASTRKNLDELTLAKFIHPGRQPALENIRTLYDRHENLERYSRLWNSNHRLLTHALYDELVFTANELKVQISDQFKKTLYTHPFKDQPHMAQGLIDWINGYKRQSQTEEDAQAQSDRQLLPALKLCETHKNIKLTVRGVLTGALILLIYASAHALKIDTTVYQFLKDTTLRVLSLDPASRNLREKKEYFHRFILSIDNEITREEILKQVAIFNNERLYEKESGTYFLAEKILQKYLLLMCRQDIPDELRDEVLNAAGLIDLNIKAIIADISAMFKKKIVEDSKLRNKLLEVRRAFVRHNIFPFTFIVIDNDTPYLFLYPEYILKRFKFPAELLDRIGFKSSYYSQYVKFPLKVFVVKGDRYPFKDRAGYFEGEYAIVFADLAAQTEWSAWHEFAHIIDQMRFTYGGRMYPKNIEVNAVLFPAMFSQNPQGYFAERIFPMVETKDGKDAYVQASKGILNGYLLLEAQRTGTPPVEITDELLDKDIAAAKKLIFAKCNDSLRGAGLQIFQKPEEYLKTAKAGQYRGVISNAEEIIAGTPRAPYQGFILEGGKSSSVGASGIKFVFDNQNNDMGFFQGKNIFGIIQEIFFFMVQAHRSDTKGFTLMNMIAAAVDFILILGFFLSIHWWSTPIRKRKFYGPDFSKWIGTVFKDNPISDGRGSGEQPGAKQLLVKALLSDGTIPDDLRGKIKALKAGMSHEELAVFDTLLTVAPFNPKISLIISKWHDFMFWFPFLGPITARTPWIFPRQKAFSQWEIFNEEVFALAKSIKPGMQPQVFRDAYLNILKRFKKPVAGPDRSTEKSFLWLKETERQVQTLLNETNRTTEQHTPVAARQLPWSGQQDGEFDHLAAYSWNDDVKRIDWKATARSPNQEAKVRKYAGNTSAHFDFLLDFRRLSKQEGRDKIARDLAQSMQILKNDNELKSLTLIMPSGSARQSLLNLKSQQNRYELLGTIWNTVSREFEDDLNRQQAFKAEELVFYTDEENKKYHNITQLTEFENQDETNKIPESIPTKSFNIYLIGVDHENRDRIIEMLPKTHQPFYWK